MQILLGHKTEIVLSITSVRDLVDATNSRTKLYQILAASTFTEAKLTFRRSTLGC